jgi:cytochrome c-type biogenesis protein
MIGIEPLLESLLADIGGLTPLTVALVALAGLIIGVAPSSFPLIAVAASLGTGEGEASTDDRRFRGLWLATGFAFGIITVDVVIGALFGFVGFAVLRVVNGALAYIYSLLAVILALTGLALWRFIRIPIPVLHPSARPAQSFIGSFALGLPFGLSTCPACTPLLLPVVFAASASADPIMGMVLMGSFGLARSIPIVIAGTAAARLAHLKHRHRFMLWTERVGGALIMVMAAYFAYQAALYAGWLS